MLRPLIPCLLAVALLFAGAACSDSPTGPKDETPIAFQTLARASADGTETLAQGSWGSYDFAERQNIVIRNQADLEAFWAALYESQSPTPTLPDVDFSEASVVAVLFGGKPSTGYGIEVEDIVLDGDRAGVHVVESTPGNGCAVGRALTSPYHIVKVDARPQEFSFESQEKQDEPCGE